VNRVNPDVIDPWLQLMWEWGGTDLMLTAGSPPRIRVDGRLQPIEGEAVLTGEALEKMVAEMVGPEIMGAYGRHQDADFSFSWRDLARLRANVFRQRGDIALALRMIPSCIPSFEELGLPAVATWLAELPRGLVLVTGPTGSGKSTTLASIIDYINDHRELHILTVEDPIEYVHEHKASVVNQREIGLDCETFEGALRSALREDPDVLLVGEMRDLESIHIALTMAETGHLVFATLHTNDTAQALDRIIDVFPDDRRDQIRVQLAASLNAVIAQRLIPRPGYGMVAAFEVLIATPAVRNILREGKTNQLRNAMTTGQQDGMVTLETSMARLIQAGLISYEAAMGVTMYPRELARAVNPAFSSSASS
jgi:twitching motility protein PilT